MSGYPLVGFDPFKSVVSTPFELLSGHGTNEGLVWHRVLHIPVRFDCGVRHKHHCLRFEDRPPRCCSRGFLLIDSYFFQPLYRDARSLYSYAAMALNSLQFAGDTVFGMGL